MALLPATASINGVGTLSGAVDSILITRPVRSRLAPIVVNGYVIPAIGGYATLGTFKPRTPWSFYFPLPWI